MTAHPQRSRAARWVGFWPARRLRATLTACVYRPVLRIWLRNFVVTGVTRIPPGPVLFAAQHTSMADTPLLLMALGRRADCLVITAARDYFFPRSRPGFGLLVGLAFAAIPIDRTGFARRSLVEMQAWLAAGYSVVIFPHGTIPASETARRTIHRGVVRLAHTARCPIVPVRFKGANDLLPPGTHWPRRAAVEVLFFPPLFPASLSDEEAILHALAHTLS